MPVLNTTSPALERRAPKCSPVRRLPSSSTNSAFDISARDRKSTRLNSSHRCISYAVFCLKKKKKKTNTANKHPTRHSPTPLLNSPNHQHTSQLHPASQPLLPTYLPTEKPSTQLCACVSL